MLKNPYDVTDLICSDSTMTSIALQWKASKTSNVTYEVYNGPSLISATSHTYLVAELLSANTVYTFTVKCRDADGNKSEGRAITVRTLNNFAYSTTKTPAVTKIEFPTIKYHLIEAEVSVAPYKNTWNQFLLEVPECACGVQWEFDGRRISPVSASADYRFEKMYINHTEVGIQAAAIVYQNIWL